MSPLAMRILASAYNHYLQTSEVYCEYLAPNSSAWFDVLTGASQLFVDGYIEEVPWFVERYSAGGSTSLPGDIPVIDFNITEKGIAFMRRNRENEL